MGPNYQFLLGLLRYRGCFNCFTPVSHLFSAIYTGPISPFITCIGPPCINCVLLLFGGGRMPLILRQDDWMNVGFFRAPGPLSVSTLDPIWPDLKKNQETKSEEKSVTVVTETHPPFYHLRVSTDLAQHEQSRGCPKCPIHHPGDPQWENNCFDECDVPIR